MDITQLVLDDHHEQRRLFAILEQIDRTDLDRVAVVWNRLAAFLDLHAEAEERIFYPALLHVGRGVGGSHTPEEETDDALRAEVEQHGGVVVAVIDHAAAAQAVGLTLPATQVIIFGNPRAGTSLMQAVPETAIDLPLRILVRADGQPGSLVSWQDP